MSGFDDSQLSTLSAALGDNADGQRSVAADLASHDQAPIPLDQETVDAAPSQLYEPDWQSVYRQHEAETAAADHVAWQQSPNGRTLNGTAADENGSNSNPTYAGHDLLDPRLDQPGPSRKKPRKRGSTAKGKTSSIIEEGMVTEYEDPSGDFRAGVIYVHAGPNASQACMRCHAIKRKCDNNRPRCAGCAKADEACAYEMNPATTAFVTNLKEEHQKSQQRLREAEDRVAQLEAALLAAGQPCPPRAVAPIDTRVDGAET